MFSPMDGISWFAQLSNSFAFGVLFAVVSCEGGAAHEPVRGGLAPSEFPDVSPHRASLGWP